MLILKLLYVILVIYRLGSRVAMFRYSSVEIYSASKPPPLLEFHNPNGPESLMREAKDVSDQKALTPTSCFLCNFFMCGNDCCSFLGA